MCVVQQRPPLQRLVLYPLLKVFYLPPNPSPSAGVGQTLASHKAQQVLPQMVLFQLLSMQPLLLHVLLPPRFVPLSSP